MDEWCNAVQTQAALAKYPTEKTKILHQDIFWFFLKDEQLISKTINDSNIYLDKFPACNVRQLAKKMESSQVTARHIKQVASDPKAAQINLMQHQCADIPASKHNKKKTFGNLYNPVTKIIQLTDHQYLHTTTRKVLIQRIFTRTKRDVRNVVILCI